MRIMHSRRLFFRQTVKLLLNNKPTMRINTHSLVRAEDNLSTVAAAEDSLIFLLMSSVQGIKFIQAH